MCNKFGNIKAIGVIRPFLGVKNETCKYPKELEICEKTLFTDWKIFTLAQIMPRWILVILNIKSSQIDKCPDYSKLGFLIPLARKELEG